MVGFSNQRLAGLITFFLRLVDSYTHHRLKAFTDANRHSAGRFNVVNGKGIFKKGKPIDSS
jgi:hypothetical protein